MKKVLLTCFFALLITSTFAQSQQFKKGQTDINIGVGFITPFFDLDNYDVKTKTPPITITADHAITDELSVGVYVATSKNDVYGTIYWNNGTQSYQKQSTLNHFILGGRLLYHFDVAPNFDVYAGGMLGYNTINEKAEPNIYLVGKTEASGFTYSILGGGRYRFSQHEGVFAEIGYGVTIFNIGINIKF